MKNSVQVTILGQQYTVRSSTDPGEVLQVAALVNRRIAEAQQGSGISNSYTAVVLALLNVAGELHQLQKSGPTEGDQEAEDRLRNLLGRMETACDQKPFAG